MNADPKKLQEIRAHCPKCGPDRVATIVASHTVTRSGPALLWETYRIISCGGCRYRQLQIVNTNSEDFDYDEDGSNEISLNETIEYWLPLTKHQRPE